MPLSESHMHLRNTVKLANIMRREAEIDRDSADDA